MAVVLGQETCLKIESKAFFPPLNTTPHNLYYMGSIKVDSAYQ